MTANVGKLDRMVRLALGLVLVLAPIASGMAIFETTWIMIASIAAGLVMLAVSATRFCPLYTILGFKTCKV